MVKSTFLTEREGQIKFFNDFGIDWKNKPVLVDSTDGIWNGNLFEFKLNISDLNKVLFQTIKYLSRMRIKGEPIPENILLIDLNNTKLYLYHSSNYFNDIHKIYTGSASIDVSGFIGNSPIKTYDYSLDEDAGEVKDLLKEKNFMKIKLDGDCIVGWAEKYYRENPGASKGDFLGDGESGVIKISGEIRDPKKFKDYIIPYDKDNNEEFKFVMDKLNDRLNKKDLGAFYTPVQYAEKAAELVREAIKRKPEENDDYIILDRCAGTGNLESVLTDEELSHCIISTYEYWEWKILNDKFSDKVRAIIPPTESHVSYDKGFVANADAMSEEFINNPTIKKYIDNPKCTVIMYENPPYRDAGAVDISSTKGFENYVNKEMAKEHIGNKTTAFDLSNMFIWSAYKYYLRQPTDSYIVFSPIKYWKIHNLSYKKFINGFAFNRKHFHCSASTITCILWSNEDDLKSESITLKPYDIKDNHIVEICECEEIILRKSKFMSNKYFPKTNLFTGVNGIVCGINGYEVKKESRGTPLYNKDYFAYIRINGFNLDPLNRTLTTVMNYAAMGRYLTKDNYLNLLPLFVAKLFQEDNWYESDIYATTSDGGDKYTKDPNFIKTCLIYTCLSNQNKCLSFKGSDGRDYQNELCFDTNALAKKQLDTYKLTKEEQTLINLYNKILEEAKKTSNYDSHWNYGIYQISEELNTYTDSVVGKTKVRVYDYPELNGDLNSLRDNLKQYYKKNITPKMFKYELIK